MLKKLSFLLFLILLFSCSQEENPVGISALGPGKIVGYVTDGETGFAISQALITSQASTSAIITDIDGFYIIENVSPGSYSMSASKNGYQSASISVSVDSSMTAQADFVLLEIPPQEYGELEGKVFNAVNDQPVDEAVITITSTDENNITDRKMVTETSGAYSFISLIPGTYEVTAEKVDFVNKTITIEIVADSTSFAAINLIPDYGSITGIVSSRDTNIPIAGALISTSPATNTVTTDSTGRYTIEYAPLANGQSSTYTVTASKAGYTDAQVSINVNPGKTAIGNIQM